MIGSDYDKRIIDAYQDSNENGHIHCVTALFFIILSSSLIAGLLDSQL